MNRSLDRRKFLQIATPIAAACSLPGVSLAGYAEAESAGPFTLWQLSSQTPSQMMGYVLQTGSGKVMVIDGGTTGDAPYLRGFLGALGNHVEAWFISHAHSDHYDAVTAILDHPDGITVDKFYGSLPGEAWIEEHEAPSLGSAQAFNRAIKESGHEVLELALGQVLTFDGLTIEILGIKNPEITQNAINNSSVVMRLSGRGKRILFTGDLGAEGGRKLMNSPYARQLKADYVQMAHHGQNGVDEDFYRAVGATCCLWPTPRWLWDNDNGGGRDSGPWRTLEVRAWMDNLNVRDHRVAADGLHRLTF